MSTDTAPEAIEAIPVQPEKAAPKIQRLDYSQISKLVEALRTAPEASHETIVAFAAAVSKDLGFNVTPYSLKEGLVAAGRDLERMLKPKEADEATLSRVVEIQAGKILSLEIKVAALDNQISYVLQEIAKIAAGMPKKQEEDFLLS